MTPLNSRRIPAGTPIRRTGQRALLALAVAALSAGAQADFSVSGTQLLDGNGEPFVMRGINHPHAWFTDQTPKALADIAATGANTVRVVLSNGYRWNRTSAQEVAEIIRLAREHNLVAVLDVHDTTGFGEEPEAAPLSSAVDYWLEIADTLKGQEDYVLLNIANEPFGNEVDDYYGETWISEHRTAIQRLREAGLKHTLIVDAANWGQDWQGIMITHASQVADADPLNNTMFSVHMYEVYPERSMVEEYMRTFLETHRLPLLIGEFGMDHYGQPVAAADIMELAEQYGVGYTGWSWSGNSGGTESLDLVQNFDPGSLSPWGDLLLNGTHGLKATARPATIFGNGGDQGVDDDAEPGDGDQPGGNPGGPGNGGGPEQPPVDPEDPDDGSEDDLPGDDDNGGLPDDGQTPPPDPVAPGGIACEAEGSSFWSKGYKMTVRVTNTGDLPIDGWQVQLDFPQEAGITFGWNARIRDRHTPQVTASSVFWNDELAPGESTEFGFLGLHDGELQIPQCSGQGQIDRGDDDDGMDPDLPVDPPVGDPVDPIGPDPDPEEPVDPVDPDQPIDPEDPRDPTDPIDPEEPVDPVDPIDPVDPEEPVDPIDPDQPEDPVDGDEGDVDDPVDGDPADHVDNPFAGASAYINPDYARLVQTSVGQADSELVPALAQVASQPTAVWLDRIEAIHGGDVNGGRLSLREHLDNALAQKPEGEPITATFVVYNLPDRDCAALASNGTLHADQNGLSIYKSDYIDVIAETFADPKYRDIRIVTIVEPDSLPNLVTNLDDPDCAKVQQDGTYVDGIRYALQKFADMPNVYTYLDIAHSGWLGWPSNFDPAVQLYTNVVRSAAGGDMTVVDGFVSNVANYTPTEETWLPDPEQRTGGGNPVRAADFYEWNPLFDELDYTERLRQAFINAGFPDTIGMLIDTSRNGWGGAERPEGVPQGVADINQYVDTARLDRRHHRGNWCNPAGAGIGELPQVSPLGEGGHLDAYVWIKPPGESDGTSDASQTTPDEEGKSFDQMCSPQYTAESGYPTGALDGAPPAGHWFHEQFMELVENAHPPLK